MRDSISKKQECKLLPNQQLIGRWHQNPYRIIRQLGYGATGTVYLAESNTGPVALKIAQDSMSITSEVNVMRHFSKVQGPSLGPSFYDVDDYVTPQGTYSFYVMEYLNGEPFLPFLKNRGMEWIGIMVVQLLGDLHLLHKEGWVFGDLKPENLLITSSPTQVRWLDVGGMTKVGRSIKEYTEFFDRGYWGLGSRKAEPSYDLFSVAMLLINRGYPSRFEKSQTTSLTRLMDKVRQKNTLLPYEPVIRKALQGKYGDALLMRKDLMKLLQDKAFFTKKSVVPSSNGHGKKIKTSERRSDVRKKAHSNQREPQWTGLLETCLVATFLLALYLLYLFGQTM